MTEAEERPTLVLLDGHSLAYRAFYALPDSLRTQTGQLTNAVYGFTSMLIKLLGDRHPDGIAVCFDKGRDVQRTAAYPEYKANRSQTPDEFRTQLDLIREVLAAMTIPVVELAGVEADDVIATIAERGKAKGFHVLILTGDRDTFQLVDDDLTVLYTARGVSDIREMTPPEVEEKYGIPPDRYVEYAALRGDNSDNLPGVPGVGEKTAAKLITEFGHLDGIYAHLDQISGKKVPAMLAEHRDQVYINRSIMTLRRDLADLEVDLADLRITHIDADAVRGLFGTLEFRALYDRLVDEVLGDVEEEEAAGFDTAPRHLGAGELREWLDGLTGPLAIVPLTERPVPHLRWVSIGLAAVGRSPATAVLDDLADEDRAALADALADHELPKVVHDAKALDHAALSRGWDVAGVRTDTELAAYLINPEQRSFDLERIALQYLSRTLTVEDAGDDEGQLSLGVEDEPWHERALRAQATLELAEHLHGELVERDQVELHDDIELLLAPVLARMERAGIAIDRSVLDEIRGRLAERAAELEREVWDHAGERFNVGSGPQLQEVLFDQLGLPKTRRIKTGYSTDATQLQNIIDAHPIVQAILDWREVTKLLSTYIDALPPLIDDETGRVHTTLSQTTAATGRLASSNPNLQNIPVRREEGREIRRAFTAGEGYDTLMVADYSQIELRIMAHLCQDDGLLEAFGSGEDIHATTAAKVFDLPLEHVDAALRDRAKAINYGLAYGLTSFGLSQQLGIPPDEAQEIVDAYMERFPDVAGFLRGAVETARKTGFTRTLFGRRRYLPDLLSDNRNRRGMAERMALNAPIQGTAADIIKLAMVRVDRALAETSLRIQMLLQVHDELIFEVADDDLDEARELVVTEMCAVADLDVPLEVDTAAGVTWFDAQKH
ncbi:MAG: DNA polymerase I [Actinobacteria bacterium]|nr:DNA polymerase I [Actinomycetota bacterium]